MGVFKLFAFAVVVIGSVSAAIHRALFGPRAQARKRLKEASRELTDGAVVTLTGKVVALKQLIEGPLSGREGVAFSSRARLYNEVRSVTVRGRIGARPVAQEITEALMVEFELDTADGKVVIADSALVIEFPPEPIIPRKIDREQKFLLDHGYDVSAGDAGFDEIIIKPGTRVSVHGAVHFEAVPGESGYRETGKRVVLTAPPGHPLTIGRPV